MANFARWVKFKFFFRCMSKSSAHDDNVIVVAPTSPTSPTPPSDDINHLKQFTYRELVLATKYYSVLLGEGGFGQVYKGCIRCPSSPGVFMPVAVKTLDREGTQGHKEWEAEINYLGALQHPNLVKLVGYCIEDEHRMLVYEYMLRGSLENHLFRRSTPLPWNVRMKIMLGAAKGLAFLHEEAEKPVIYRDFKTSNILLDSEYNAKLSDFGLAKDAPVGDKTHVSTQVMGTQGYVDPQYVMSGHLSFKSDVYSFGVVLLEVLTGRKAIDLDRPEKEQCLIEWAKPYLKYGVGFYQLMDPKFEGQYSSRGAYKAMRLVSLCLCRDQNSRPSMSEVVKILKTIHNSNMDMLCSPSPPSPLIFKSSPIEPSSSNSSRHGDHVNKHCLKVGSSSLASVTPTRFQASPSNLNSTFPSPNPPLGENP